MDQEPGVRSQGSGDSTCSFRASPYPLAPGSWHAGFTLVEILITLALFGLVVTMVYGGLWSTIDGMRRLEARSDRQQAARILLEMVDRELRSALLADQDSRLFFVGKDGFLPDGLPADELTWVQASHVKLHPSLPEADTSEVAYWLHAQEEGELALYKREETTLDGDPEGEGAQYLLSTEIVGLDFKYYGDVGWVDEWDSRQTKRLPKIVQTTLYLPPESDDSETPAVEIRSLVGLPLGGAL